MKNVTLLYLRRDNQILLGMKKRRFGAGKWNGIGGKADEGETSEQTAIRECQEEIGVTPVNPQKVGYIQFLMPEDPEFDHWCSIFVATGWEGEPTESEEMRPEWFDLDNIPYKTMWADNPIWLPHLLAGEKFEAIVNATHSEVLSYEFRIVETIKGGDLRGTFEQTTDNQAE